MRWNLWQNLPNGRYFYKGVPNESSEDFPCLSKKEEKSENRWNAKIVALTVIVVVLLCTHIPAVVAMVKMYRNCANEHHLLESYKVFSNVPKQLVEFQPQSFPNVTLSMAGNPWENLQPDTLGFIIVDEPSKYGLYGGYPVGNTSESKKPENSEIYCISMFHQLHCLNSIKRAFEELKDQRASFDEKTHHLKHCLDYLRQGVMCAGDLTLEKSVVVNGELDRSVDGWGVIHECKNWNSMYDIASVMGML